MSDVIGSGAVRRTAIGRSGPASATANADQVVPDVRAVDRGDADRNSTAASPAAFGLSPSHHNLLVRIASAVVMIAAAVGLALAGPVPFGLLVLAVALMVAWEWSHLVGGAAAGEGFGIYAVALIAAVALTLFGLPVLACLALAAGAIVLAGGGYGENPLLSAAGVAYAGLAAVALISMRADPVYGLLAVLLLFLSVWTNDSMAFAAGKAIGRYKLWPAISPKKTWEGFAGGILASGVAGYAFALVVPEAIPSRLAVIGMLAGVVAVAGDLAESALKRRFGVKDAGAIIPGHGGVMDRMDGIVAVAVAAALAAAALGGRSPAAAILIGG